MVALCMVHSGHQEKGGEIGSMFCSSLFVRTDRVSIFGEEEKCKPQIRDSGSELITD